MVARDQSDAHYYRIAINFECPSCNAGPGGKCATIGPLMRLRIYDVNVYHFFRITAAAVGAARHLASVEAISELMERDVRGKSWLEARVAIDKAPAVIK
jgi:hypothetical protein